MKHAFTPDWRSTCEAHHPGRDGNTGDNRTAAAGRRSEGGPTRNRPGARGSAGARGFLLLALLTLVCVGCQSPGPTFIPAERAIPDRDITLREGDIISLIFPGSPDLNTTQQIRRDGKINLVMVGDVQAAGLAPVKLEEAVLAAYGDQLVSPQVTVSLQSAAFSVFVTGKVMRPGKVTLDRPLTLIEAIMEAGGFAPQQANLKAVRVMRRDGDQTQTYTVNLKPAMDGEPCPAFYLRPFDIVYVPERFSLF
jgi:polysaccharide export outer membrane protein